MTYCLAVKLNAGLVFASDSRTSAGVDSVSTYSKMHAFNMPGDRTFVLLTAGNLATTQSLVNQIKRDLENDQIEHSLATVSYVSDAAEYVGELSASIQATNRKKSKKEDVSFEATLILGGQIRGREHDIFMIYPEGNYISAPVSQPYLQIGETKYGKPILDRLITPATSLEDAARCALLSIDSTVRSNLTVGPPFELILYARDSLDLDRVLVLDQDSEFYATLQHSWVESVKRGFAALPRFEWELGSES